MGLRSLTEVPLPEPHPSIGNGRPDGTRPSGFLRRQGSLAGCVLYRATGADHSHYRSQRGGQDHFGPVPVRFDERAGRDDPVGREASWAERNGGRRAFLIMQDVNLQLFGDSVLAEARLGSTATEQEALAALEQMDLVQYAQAHPLALSGGQKQRLAIVDGCLSGKELLIFDEPTSGLDYAHMLEVSRLLRELAKQGLCVVVITHDGEFLRERRRPDGGVGAKGTAPVSIYIHTAEGGSPMALHASGEDYLEAILVLHKKMGMVRSVDVAPAHGGVQAKRVPCGGGPAGRGAS